MPNLGMGELIIVLLIVLLIFGASRLPQIGEGLGKAIKGLKRGVAADEDIDVTPKQPDENKRMSSKSSAEQVDDARNVSDAEIVEKNS